MFGLLGIDKVWVYLKLNNVTKKNFLMYYKLGNLYWLKPAGSPKSKQNMDTSFEWPWYLQSTKKKDFAETVNNTVNLLCNN